MKRNQKAWLLTWEWIGDHAAVEDRIAGILRPRLSREVVGEIVGTIYAVHEGYVSTGQGDQKKSHLKQNGIRTTAIAAATHLYMQTTFIN